MDINIYIYIYIEEVCVSIFPNYSARYVKVERDIYWDREKTEITVSSLQVCFVITHTSGDFIIKSSYKRDTFVLMTDFLV